MRKLLDKLFQLRITAMVRKATFPWQAGGERGADDAAWLLQHMLSAYRRMRPGSKAWLTFVDNGSALCRPPDAFILEGLTKAGVSALEWRMIRAMLNQLRGVLKTGD